MSSQIFNCPPTVELLDYLSPSRFQNKNLINLQKDLFKAVRMWVILYSLYGDSSDLNLNISLDFSLEERLANPPWFKKADWENQIINNNLDVPPLNRNQKITKKEKYQHSKIYKLDIKQLLFNHNNVKEPEWRDCFKQYCQIKESDLNKILGQQYKDENDEFKKYPFAITLRTLLYTFKTLHEKGLLYKNGQEYRKKEDLFESLPKQILAVSRKVPEILTDSIPNLISWEDFFEPINGKRRFFIDLENIISKDIDDLQQKLKSIWSLDPVPPIKLIYRSAKQFQDEFECIVYPVCLYQIKRAPYLFAYGTNPHNDKTVNWYDYRVDKIIALEQLNWTDRELPEELVTRYKNNNLFEPDYVREQMESALGYDFYQSQEELILKFNPYFHANYIKDTERDRDFFLKQIPYQSVKTLTDRALLEGLNIDTDKKKLLSRLASKEYQNAIYCKIKYFINDNNVIMRLRAWSPNVEVILPWGLRKRMKEDAQKTWKLYE